MSWSLDSVPHRLRPARDEPQGVLVLFHGRGTSELDLLPLLDELDPERRLIGVTPRGPLSLPPGGWHWYIVPRVGFPEPRSFLDTYARVSTWLDALAESFGVPWQRIVLGGFSQGAAMSYAFGLGQGRPLPAGIIALSGFIPAVDGFELDLDGRAGLPVAIGHGTHDPVIPVEFAHDARRRLQAAGLDVLYRESPMTHSIDPAFVPALRNWLLARTGAPARK